MPLLIADMQLYSNILDSAHLSPIPHENVFGGHFSIRNRSSKTGAEVCPARVRIVFKLSLETQTTITQFVEDNSASEME